MAAARAAVHERFGIALEHEVRFLGSLELPSL
jgi:UDP-N-acetylenolpyruvoylglucosamine reductase